MTYKKTISMFKEELKSSFLLIVCILTFPIISFSQEKPTNTKSESPYFFVKSENSEVEQLPLKSTDVEVNVSGVIAEVSVTQEYQNTGTVPLEATYVFPASINAAVHAMKMTIGERTIIANIREKEKARAEYEAAKEAGKTASLLEQKRPNVFEMNVANILPGDIIKVELIYNETIIPEEGIYEFVYPTVVGPRYSSSPSEELTASVNDNWISSPYTHEGEAPLYTFAIESCINSGLALRDVRCASHDVDINFNSKTNCEIILKDEALSEGNRDYVLQYRLQGNKIESGLMAYEGSEENFFMLTIQPPEKVTPAQMPGREYVFIVDISGSMNGFPLEVSKTLMRDLLGNLKPTDKFNILLFAGSSSVFKQGSVDANEQNINAGINFIGSRSGGGGTELLSALRRAMNLPYDDQYSRSFVIATDGYVSVEKETYDYMRENIGEANFFSFGIGSSVNRYIIDGMAKVGRGEPFVILNQGEAAQKAKKFREYIDSPVLTDINIDFEGLEVYDVEPGKFNDLFADRPLVITGKYKGALKGKAILQGASGGARYYQEIDLMAQANDENEALKYLWARNKIKDLADYQGVIGTEANKEEITKLGLEYGLLTDYTSFVAIDSEMRNQDGTIKVSQPLPLPQGVSDMAVGGNKTMHYSYSSAPMIQNCSPAMTMDAITLSENVGIIEYDVEILDKDISDINRMEKEEEVVYELLHVTKQPEYPNGQEAMMRDLLANLLYPKICKEAAISGTVYLQFTVDKKGRIKDIVVLRGVHEELDKAAIEALKKLKNFTPGEMNGKKVNVKYTLPVKFELE